MESQAVAQQLESEVAAARAAIQDKERKMLELEKQVRADGRKGGREGGGVQQN